MPVTGETPHHIPGNPAVGEMTGPMSEAQPPPLAVPGNQDVNFMPDGTVADLPKYAVRGNPEPGSIMSGS